MTPSSKICFAEPLAEALGSNFTVSTTQAKFANKLIEKKLTPPPPRLNADFLGSVGRLPFHFRGVYMLRSILISSSTIGEKPMKKSVLAPAILIISMMMFPANANAFWLDVVKEFVSGGIKTIVMPKRITTAIAESKSVPATEAKKSGEQQPTPEDIYQALSKLESICNQEFANNIPCSIGIGKGLSVGMARDKAVAKARVELANTMGTYVKNNAQLDAKSNMDEEGIFKEAESYLAKSELSTEQFVSGAQQYLSYTYIDEEATQLNKGKTVYVTTVVMVINKELFGKGLEDVGKEKPLSEQIIRESKKGVIALVRNIIKKK
ncbi:MAG: hypothetical protein LBC87_05065 [Fibromonadaceae bacterium]|jgi:hypothetical protein|nr:hypothetical protein [Fibromonadaceae bacterium]